MKVEKTFVPKTGIEHPFMKERPRFIENQKEFEPIHCMNVSNDYDFHIKIQAYLVEEYTR